MSHRFLLVILLIFSVLLLGSCSSITRQIDVKRLPEQVSNQKQIHLTVWLFSATGLEDLIQQYEKEHPEIKVDIFTSQYEDVHNNLQTAFASGNGAPDICLIEVSFIERFKQFPDYFYNLADLGASDLKSEYLDWKWKQASSKDESFVFGLPTDVGPFALAYRPAFFEEAGLPSNRVQLAEKVKSWDDFLEIGKQIKARTGKYMIDNIHSLYRSILGQAEQQYFDKESGKLIVETNPAVKKAWDYAVKAKQLGLSAGLTTYKPEWGRGLTDGDFATLLAPSWMLNYMKDNAPQAFGQWDVTRFPGGSGNWGGSFLSLPKEGKHPQEAFDLIKWLTAPEQQLVLYQQRNNFPSAEVLYEDQRVKGKTDPYFSQAPVGKIFSDAARQVKPIYEGPYQFIVMSVIESEMYKIDWGEATPEEAWKEGIALIHKQLARYGINE